MYIGVDTHKLDFPHLHGRADQDSLGRSAVRDRVKTFRISVSRGEMRKVGPGSCDVPRRPEKPCRHRGLA